MKIKQCSFFVLLIVLFTGKVFSQTIPNPQESGLCKSSFGAFSNSFDNFFNPLFIDESVFGTLCIFGGINDNQLNIACSVPLGKKWQGSFGYFEKISNYKWWPENMTDESWSFMFSHKSGFSILGGYYDFCYSKGKGTAEPYLVLGKNKVFNGPASIEGGVDIAFRYSAGMILDLIQPKGSFVFFFGENPNKGLKVSYELMFTLKGPNNSTDLSNTAPYNKILIDYGNEWKINSLLNCALHPLGYFVFNAINFTESLNNVVPEKNQREFYLKIPIAFKFKPSEQNIFTFVAAFQIDIYHGTFNHFNSQAIGGINYHGWVPGVGFGLGLIVNLNDDFFLEIGVNHIAFPYLTEDMNFHKYQIEDISLANLLEAPLSVSFSLKI